MNFGSDESSMLLLSQLGVLVYTASQHPVLIFHSLTSYIFPIYCLRFFLSGDDEGEQVNKNHLHNYESLLMEGLPSNAVDAPPNTEEEEAIILALKDALLSAGVKSHLRGSTDPAQ